MAISVNLRLVLHNPGHIELGKEPWIGQSTVQKHKRFATFDSDIFGVRAIAVTLMTYYDKRFSNDGSKIDTPFEIADRWSETDRAAYAANLATAMGVGVHDTINLHDYATMKAAVATICTQENGPGHYTDAVIDEGLARAGFVKAVPASNAVAASTSPTVIGGSALAIAATIQAVVAPIADAWDKLSALGIDPRIIIWGTSGAIAIAGGYLIIQWIKRRQQGLA